MLFFVLIFSTYGFSDLKQDLDRQLEPLMEKVISWRHDIHQNPELSNREYRTAKKIEIHLRSLGIKVETKVAYTGVVGLIEGGLPGPTIAFFICFLCFSPLYTKAIFSEIIRSSYFI